MKKFLCILILTLGWLVSKGQLYPPIQPYQENDYSLSQVKRFAMAQTELSSSWRKEFLAIVNYGLAQAGESMYLGEDKILSALDHVVYERRNLNYSFENSRNISNEVKFYPDFGFDGMVATFKYGKCSLVIFKTRCMNLLKCSIDIVTQVEITPEIVPDRFVPAERDQNQYAWTTITKKVQEDYINPNLFVTTIRTKTWLGKHIVPIIIGFVVTSGTIYVVANHHHHYVAPPPVIEPRTMPPGIPAVPATPTPGVPSDPRNQPGGVGMKFNNFNTTDHAIVVFRFGH